jgi:hypothetical protein
VSSSAVADERPITDHGADGAFDDDRLLAYALELEDDPELAQAAASDDELARRLAAMRGDVARIQVQVDRVVPPPVADYADLSDPRWAGLAEVVGAGAQTTPKRRGARSRWLRVLAPVAVIAVALAVGVAVIQRQGGSSTNRSALSDAGAPMTTSGAQSASSAGAEKTSSFPGLVAEFADVVLARARAAQGTVQEFLVIKVLKGEGPNVVQLNVADRPASEGRLNVLLLDPQSATSVEATAAPMPASTESTSTIDALGAAQPVQYSYMGEMALARELPAGTDPASVTLP